MTLSDAARALLWDALDECPSSVVCEAEGLDDVIEELTSKGLATVAVSNGRAYVYAHPMAATLALDEEEKP